MFRLQENIPQVYSSSSRDFQLIEHIYDIVNNASRFNVKSTSTLIDPLTCSERILPLLCTRVGFFPQHQYNTHALREIIKAFPYIIKNKGSKIGIEQAVYTVLKAENNYSSVVVDLSRKSQGIIGIYTDIFISNELLLRDVLSYIIPIGFEIELGVYIPTNPDETRSQLANTIQSISASNYEENLSVVLGVEDGELDNELMTNTIGVVALSTVINKSNINQPERTNSTTITTISNGEINNG